MVMNSASAASQAPPELFDPEFFPTPRRIIRAMLGKLASDARYYLEPSAGRGDIAEAILKRDEHRRYGSRQVQVDCVELSPDLCAILIGKELSVVGHDWLTYDGVSYYDAIVMNPPFSNGVAHLLRAWDFLHSGEIVCLLNAETIANPYTEERKRLAALIATHGTVEELGQCFHDAERRTDVSVVLVHLKKAAADDRVELWETGTAEQPIGDLLDEAHLPAVKDVLGNKQRFYDEANRHMLLAFEHARKAATFLEANSISLGNEYSTILSHALKSSVGHSRAEFLRLHRKDAWLSVFEMMHFHRWLDKKQTDELIRDVSQHGHFPFTAENIKGTLENVLLMRRKLFEQSAWNVFEALTKYFKGNTNHTEGWKSNDGFKVNTKLVFPYGCRYEKDWGFSLWYGSSSVIDIYNDLDRVLAVLDGRSFDAVRTVGVTMNNAIQESKREPLPIRSEYFDIRYFKKGTVHLKWRRYDLLEKFNLTAAAGRKWIGGNVNGREDL
jgi:hypothetical protein